MKRALFLVGLLLLISQAHGKHPKDSNEKYLWALAKENDKRGLFLVSFVGDKYLKVTKGGKLVATEKFESADLFDVMVKFKKGSYRMESLQLKPWVYGKDYVITYNALGEDINIELPVKSIFGTKSDATELEEVIGHNAEHPVYIIKSKYRGRCITLDPATNECFLKPCSKGGNDLQTFRFLTYEEAKTLEGRKKNSVEFDIKSFLLSSKVGTGATIVADKNGILFRDS